MDNKLQQAINFLRDIGLNVEVRDRINTDCFIANIVTQDQKIFCTNYAHPGDLLHEAGHVATAPKIIRQNLSHDFGLSASFDGLEYEQWMLYWNDASAIAWSYMAARHIGLDPIISLENGIYDNDEGVICAKSSFETGQGNAYTCQLFYLGMLDSKKSMVPNRWLYD